MSQAIILLGTGRCGLQAVAQVLETLGVAVAGGGLFDSIVKGILGGNQRPGGFKTCIQELSVHPYWCAAHKDLAHTAHLLWQNLDNVKLIVVKRDEADCINSYMRAYRTGRTQATDWYDHQLTGIHRQLYSFRGEVLEVFYEDLLKEPYTVAGKLASFVFNEDIPPGSIKAAAHMVSPRPIRRLEGWGQLAIGTRIAKHPEPGFFRSWTALLTAGVKRGDTVLEPVSGLPAHWAANKLVWAFLETDKDSLLFIDDDQAFNGDALYRLRDNQDNWGYDVVQALYTVKSAGYYPLIMGDQGPQGMPRDLQGQWFTIADNYKPGSVVEVDAVGLGFTLVRRGVFEAMTSVYGPERSYYFAYDRGVETEDIYFSRQARYWGFRLGVDTSVEIGHIAHEAKGMKQHREAKENKRFEMKEDEWKEILQAASSSGNQQATQLLQGMKDA